MLPVNQNGGCSMEPRFYLEEYRIFKTKIYSVLGVKLFPTNLMEIHGTPPSAKSEALVTLFAL